MSSINTSLNFRKLVKIIAEIVLDLNTFLNSSWMGRSACTVVTFAWSYMVLVVWYFLRIPRTFPASSSISWENSLKMASNLRFFWCEAAVWKWAGWDDQRERGTGNMTWVSKYVRNGRKREKAIYLCAIVGTKQTIWENSISGSLPIPIEQTLLLPIIERENILEHNIANFHWSTIYKLGEWS